MYGDFAPPCTRSCEGLGPKAPKNTLFRGLSTPPTPRAGAPFPGGKPPILRSTRVSGYPPRHREERGWGGAECAHGVCTRVSDVVSIRHVRASHNSSRAGTDRVMTGVTTR